MADTVLEVASKYLGRLEICGHNDGPQLRLWRAALGPGVMASPHCPWCSIFVVCVLMERNKLNRKQLVASLGFRPGMTYLESCDSMVAEILEHDAHCAKGSEYVVHDPRPGDVFFRRKVLRDGSFSTSDFDHTGFVAASPVGGSFATIEGNTTAGTQEGSASREGDGAYRRSRIHTPNRYLFARFRGLTGLD